jgi:GNAT superfamily N-acetyltransferase
MRAFGGVTAFTTRVPLALFNGCIVVEPASEGDLRAALRWMAGWEVPYRVWIDERFVPGLAEVAMAYGFQRDAAWYPGMVLHPPPAHPGPAPGVTIQQAGHAGFLAAFSESGAPSDLVGRLFRPSFAADEDVRLFIARLDGHVVGTSIAIRTADAAGVYAVRTLPDARRRGVGTALTWAAVAASLAWGCDTVVLQASDMGYSIYVAMGFRTVSRYATFRQPFPDSG